MNIVLAVTLKIVQLMAGKTHSDISGQPNGKMMLDNHHTDEDSIHQKRANNAWSIFSLQIIIHEKFEVFCSWKFASLFLYLDIFSSGLSSQLPLDVISISDVPIRKKSSQKKTIVQFSDFHSIIAKKEEKTIHQLLA